MGPTLAISEEIHASKYRQEGESFREAMSRIADDLKDNDEHFYKFRDTLLDMRFLPAGRVQTAIGSARQVTAFNCFVAPSIPDSMDGIMDVAKYAAETMRLGGGIGYDFSTIRPRGDLIKKIGSQSSGPISFMRIFDAICSTVQAAGHRRGAQMGVLRVDHPDIEEFIHAKQNTTNLTNFNISIGVTDEFMQAVEDDTLFDLRFEGRVYKSVRAKYLWNEIMRATWDWAEPGVLFIDRINEMNNLWYCETIAATNPCGEQPLPPNGACLLGSFNLVKYIERRNEDQRVFNFKRFLEDIPVVVRAMDNIIDRTIYPKDEQRLEAISKRRMGLGVTGVANALEALGLPYASPNFLATLEMILQVMVNEVYKASALLAAEKGSFPLFESDLFMAGNYVKRLDPDVRELIKEHGLRNSHLTSIAPTGTISLTADNISSGIEPVFSYGFDRTINMPDGVRHERVDDYGVREFGVRGRTADSLDPQEHLAVLGVAAHWMDSAVSKTCNIGPNVTFDDFKDVYYRAWRMGCKGVTTFRAAGKRMGILVAAPQEGEGAACFIDPETGKKTCE